MCWIYRFIQFLSFCIWATAMLLSILGEKSQPENIQRVLCNLWIYYYIVFSIIIHKPKTSSYNSQCVKKKNRRQLNSFMGDFICFTYCSVHCKTYKSENNNVHCHIWQAHLPFFPPQFTRSITSQLIKWFSNFREFYYIQMEKFARHALIEGVADVRGLTVGRESELFRALNRHYNKASDFQVRNNWGLVLL